MRPRLDRQAVVPAVVLPASVFFGLVAGKSPVLALLGAVGVVGAVIAVTSGTVAVAAFTVMSLTFVGGRPTLMLVAALGVGLGWLASLTLTREVPPHSLSRRHLGLIGMLVAFVAWIAITQAWAPDAAAVRQTTERYAVLLIIFPAVFAVAQSRRGAIIVMGAIALGAGTSALMAMLGIAPFHPQDGSGGQPYGSRLVGGPVDDPNIFAALSLAGAAVGFALASGKVGLSSRWRWLFAASSILCLVSVEASGSRGALIAILAMVAVLPWVARRRARAIGLAAAIVGLAALLATASWSPLSQRLREDGFKSSGRIELWKVGWAMAKDHPIGGVGAGNFREVSVNYVLRVGVLDETTYIINKPLVVHNSYLQLFAEAGLPALALYIGIVLTCFRCAFRARRLFASRGDPGMELLASALIVALAGMFGALFVVSFLDYGRALFVMLALCPALLALAASQPPATRRTLRWHGTAGRPHAGDRLAHPHTG